MDRERSIIFDETGSWGPAPDTPPSKRRFTPKKAGAVLASGLALAGSVKLAADLLLDEPGRARSHAPTERQDEYTDASVNVVTWNMHSRLAAHFDDIAVIAERHRVDAFAFQEVLERDYEALEERFPEWGMHFVVADPNTKTVKGAFGNVLMTRLEATDFHRDVISGTPKLKSFIGVVDGARQDLTQLPQKGPSIKHAKKGKEEDRAVMVATMPIWDADEGRERDLDLVVSHITPRNPLHRQQLAELLDFIEQHRDDDTPLVFAGDLNGWREEIRNAFLEQGMSVPLEEGEIHLHGNHQVDYFAEYPADVLSVPEIVPLTEYRTDHYPILASYDTDAEYE